ncbi:hypothetical protein KAR04_01625, partial [Candidatus Calescamantes bacterium]|nr:hypothetical protein [Candidatus Calescamantes bacterium]
MKKEIIAIFIIGLILGIGIVFIVRGLPSKQKPSKNPGVVVNEIVTDNQEKEINKVQEKQVPEMPKKKVHLEDGVIITSDIESGGEEIEFIQKVVVDLKWGTGPYQISPPSGWNFEQGEYLTYFNVDNNENIYIIDDKLNLIKKYSNKGKLLTKIKYYGNIMPKIEFNNNEQLYIYSYDGKAGTILSRYSNDRLVKKVRISNDKYITNEKEKNKRNKKLKLRDKSSKELGEQLNCQILKELNNGYLIGYKDGKYLIFDKNNKLIFAKKIPRYKHLDYNNTKLLLSYNSCKISNQS